MKIKIIAILLFSNTSLFPNEEALLTKTQSAFVLLQEAAGDKNSISAKIALEKVIEADDKPNAYGSIEGYNAISEANLKFINECDAIEIDGSTASKILDLIVGMNRSK